jgi:hypothetical protein
MDAKEYDEVLERAGAQINALHDNERRLIDELAALRRDAERYRWLAPRMLAADFDYNGEGVCALVFEMPGDFSASADCNETIDSAMVAALAGC